MSNPNQEPAQRDERPRNGVITPEQLDRLRSGKVEAREAMLAKRAKAPAK